MDFEGWGWVLLLAVVTWFVGFGCGLEQTYNEVAKSCDTFNAFSHDDDGKYECHRAELARERGVK